MTSPRGTRSVLCGAVLVLALSVLSCRESSRVESGSRTATGAPSALSPEEAKRRIVALHCRPDRQGFVGAARGGQLELVQLFFAAGLDPVGQGWGGTALHEAIRLDRGPVVMLLLTKGIPLTADLTTAAVKAGNLRIVRELVTRGAEVNARGFSGDGPLATAAGMNWFEAAEFLVKAGADPDPANDVPLAAACRSFGGRADARTVRLLIARGADVNRRDESGATPALCAARVSGVANLTALIEAGADLGRRDGQGDSVLRAVMMQRSDDPRAQAAALELLLATAAAWSPEEKIRQAERDLGSVSGHSPVHGYRIDRAALTARVHIGGSGESIPEDRLPILYDYAAAAFGLGSTSLRQIEVLYGGRRVGEIRFDREHGWHFVP
jgi:hypothetical protein